MGGVELGGAGAHAGLEVGEQGAVGGGEAPLVAQGAGELLNLDGVEGFFEDEQAVAFGEVAGDFPERVVGVGGAKHDLDVGVGGAQAARGLDAVDAGGHADIEEGDGEGPAGGAGLGGGLEGGLALQDAGDLEAVGGERGRGGEVRGEVGEARVGGAGGRGGGEDLAVVLVNGGQIVGDEDTTDVRRRHGRTMAGGMGARA